MIFILERTSCAVWVVRSAELLLKGRFSLVGRYRVSSTGPYPCHTGHSLVPLGQGTETRKPDQTMQCASYAYMHALPARGFCHRGRLIATVYFSSTAAERIDGKASKDCDKLMPTNADRVMVKENLQKNPTLCWE